MPYTYLFSLSRAHTFFFSQCLERLSRLNGGGFDLVDVRKHVTELGEKPIAPHAWTEDEKTELFRHCKQIRALRAAEVAAALNAKNFHHDIVHQPDSFAFRLFLVYRLCVCVLTPSSPQVVSNPLVLGPASLHTEQRSNST